MNKYLRTVFVCFVLFFCCLSVFASSNKESMKDTTFEQTYSENGITLAYPLLFKSENLNGVFMPYPLGYDASSGIGIVDFYYFAISESELNALLNKSPDQLTDSDITSLRSKQVLLAEVVSFKEPVDGKSILLMSGVSEDEVLQVGKDKDITYYAVFDNQSMNTVVSDFSSVYKDECISLQKELVNVLKRGTYSAPVSPYTGKVLSFTAKDVDGNTVRSEDIFARREVTMINIWATWCPPCVGELSALSQMNERLSSKGAQVIGICMDADTDLATCKKLLKQNNVSYLNLVGFSELLSMVELTAYPTSYFVDSEGRILTDPFVGAPQSMTKYETIIDGLLSEQEAVNESESKSGVYSVVVRDENGNPVQGVLVQFCSDSFCLVEETDGSGRVEFKVAQGIYTVHILKVPQGYEVPSDEFVTDSSYGNLSVTL